MKKLILLCLIILALTNCKQKVSSSSGSSSTNVDSLKDVSDLKMGLMDNNISKAKDLLGDPDLDDKYANGAGVHYYVYYNKVKSNGTAKDLLLYCQDDDTGNQIIKKVEAIADGESVNIPPFGSVLIKKPIVDIATNSEFEETDKYVASIDSTKLYPKRFSNGNQQTTVYVINRHVVLMTLTGINTVPGDDDVNTQRYYFKNDKLVFMFESDKKKVLGTTTLYIQNNNIVKYLNGDVVTPCEKYPFGCTFDENSAVFRFKADYEKQEGDGPDI